MAKSNAIAQPDVPQSVPAEANTPIVPSVTTVSTRPTSTASMRASASKLPTSPGTIAASIMSALILTIILGLGGWLFRRWWRGRITSPSRGARVDLTEPEMQAQSLPRGSLASVARPMQRAATFPYPFERVVPRCHPDAPHSIGPSQNEESPPTSELKHSRRHTAPTPLSPREPRPLDQFDRDLADLIGTAALPLGEADGQAHIHKASRRRTSITTFTHSSGSGSSRARRKSNAAQGRYHHLPPSAQYLVDVARYPDNVDPERPWNIRRNQGRDAS